MRRTFIHPAGSLHGAYCMNRLPAWQACALLLALALALAAVVASVGYAVLRFGIILTHEPLDLSIFVRHALRFWEQGEFYLRADDLYMTYLPGAAIFKFPPVYQLSVAPFLRHGIPAGFYPANYAVTAALYIGTVCLSLLCLLPLAGASSPQRTERLVRRLLFAGMALTLAALFEPFYHSLHLVNAEIAVGFCAVLFFLLLRRHPVVAGGLLSVTATAKLYPGILLLYGLRSQTWPLLAGFSVGASALCLLSLVVFGWPEWEYFLFSVLPLLLNEHPMGTSENLNVIFFLFPGGITHAFSRQAFAVVRALMLLAMLVVLWRSRRNDRMQDLLLFNLFLVAVVAILPNYWPSYQVLLLMPCLTALCLALQQARPWRLLLAAATAFVLMSSGALFEATLYTYYSGTLEALSAREAAVGFARMLGEASPVAALVFYAQRLQPLAPYVLWVLLALWQQQDYRRPLLTASTQPS